MRLWLVGAVSRNAVGQITNLWRQKKERGKHRLKCLVSAAERGVLCARMRRQKRKLLSGQMRRHVEDEGTLRRKFMGGNFPQIYLIKLPKNTLDTEKGDKTFTSQSVPEWKVTGGTVGFFVLITRVCWWMDGPLCCSRKNFWK